MVFKAKQGQLEGHHQYCSPLDEACTKVKLASANVLFGERLAGQLGQQHVIAIGCLILQQPATIVYCSNESAWEACVDFKTCRLVKLARG